MKYDVDIFMPYYANLQFVPEAIESALRQQGVRVLLHLVNDCSDEDDSFLIEKYKDHRNIRFYKTTENVGPYRIFNALFSQMETEFFAIFDSDDIATPYRLSNALEEIELSGAGIHTSALWNFVDPSSVKSGGAAKVDGKMDYTPGVDCTATNGTLVVSKSVFESINGFDGRMHCAGDAEFFQRAGLMDVMFHQSNEVTCFRRLHGKNLTGQQGLWGVGSAYRNNIIAIIEQRKEDWEDDSSLTDAFDWGTLDSADPSILFPKVVRERRVAGIATYPGPGRYEALLDCVASLYDQMDEIKICLNEYDEIPEALQAMSKVRCVIPDRNLTDAGKFLGFDEPNTFFFSCDDDLIYRADYAESTIERMKAHPGAIVSYHGRTMPVGRRCKSYYQDYESTYPFSHDVKKDRRVHIVGTGVTAFNTRLINLDVNQFHGRMADVDFALVANRQKVPLVVLAHEKGWIQQNPKCDANSDCIWSEFKNGGDELQTELINSVKWEAV